MSDRRIRTVSALLVSRDGKLVAQLRDDKPTIPYPGHWSTLGGRVEDGETPDEAVQQELMEEIGFCPLMRFWRVFETSYSVNGIPMTSEIYAYVGPLDRDIGEIRLREGQRLGCFGADEIEYMPFAFGLDVLFREYFTAFAR